MSYSSIPKIIGTLFLLACCFANSSVFAHSHVERDPNHPGSTPPPAPTATATAK